MNLAKRLGLKAGNERAQEILYVGLVENGVKPTPAVRELGLALGLSPRVLAVEPPAAQTA
jgi:hypothetical protein